MEATLDWREQIKSSARKCSTDSAGLVEKYRESQLKLKRELNRMGLEKNWQAERDAYAKLRHGYYSNWLSAKYPVVDLSFADSKVSLLIERTDGGARILGLADREAVKPQETIATVNRFAKQKSDSERDLSTSMPESKCQLGRFTFGSFQKNRERFRDYTGQVCCNRPAGSPTSLIKKLRDIAAIGLEAKAAAVRAGCSIEQAAFGRMFLWLPRIEDLYITEEIQVRDDPAVLVICGDRAHLVAFWDSPNEDPIEGLLREFSEGPFVK